MNHRQSRMRILSDKVIPLMLATTGDNQIFGMKPRLKTVEPVRMVQKFLR